MRGDRPIPAPREAPATALLAAVAAGAPFLLGWLSVAPNRLLSPRPVALPASPGVLAAAGVFLAACAALAWWARDARRLARAEAAAALAVLALPAGEGAAIVLDQQGVERHQVSSVPGGSASVRWVGCW